MHLVDPPPILQCTLKDRSICIKNTKSLYGRARIRRFSRPLCKLRRADVLKAVGVPLLVATDQATGRILQGMRFRFGNCFSPPPSVPPNERKPQKCQRLTIYIVTAFGHQRGHQRCQRNQGRFSSWGTIPSRDILSYLESGYDKEQANIYLVAKAESPPIHLSSSSINLSHTFIRPSSCPHAQNRRTQPVN